MIIYLKIKPSLIKIMFDVHLVRKLALLDFKNIDFT